MLKSIIKKEILNYLVDNAFCPAKFILEKHSEELSERIVKEIDKLYFKTC